MPEKPKSVTKFDFSNVIATYDYQNGTRKLRDGSKNFLWQHQTEDGWKAGRNNAPHVLYQAGTPQDVVFVVEGEKDADNLSKLDFFCVSSENGAGKNNSGKKWYPSYNGFFKGKVAYLIPDNDDVGRQFMDIVAAEIVNIAAIVKVLDLRKIYPEITEHGDISDMIAGYGPEKTLQLISDLSAVTEEWVPFTAEEKNVFNEFNFYVVPDLTAAERTPPGFLISEMIPEIGLSLLCGKPKTRKSFLALQMSIAIATGTPFFGYPVKQTSVALLDLEGSKSRISTRTKNMTVNIPRNVFIANRVKERIADGSLIEKIRLLHRQRPDIGLVVIDTYGKARGDPRASQKNAYDADIEILSPVVDMLMEEKLALLLVHHENKSRFAGDAFDSVSGSTGLTGSCDSIMQLKTIGKRFEGKGVLEFTPRDGRGGELSLEFNEHHTEWMSISQDEQNKQNNPIVKWIIANQPSQLSTGDFYSYQDLHKNVYGFKTDRAGERIKNDLIQCVDLLYTDFHIGIQIGVKYGGERGVRIISLM